MGIQGRCANYRQWAGDGDGDGNSALIDHRRIEMTQEAALEAARSSGKLLEYEIVEGSWECWSGDCLKRPLAAAYPKSWSVNPHVPETA